MFKLISYFSGQQSRFSKTSIIFPVQAQHPETDTDLLDLVT